LPIFIGVSFTRYWLTQSKKPKSILPFSFLPYGFNIYIKKCRQNSFIPYGKTEWSAL
jgi:hypothetical protein